ncbi:MAG: TOBE domain-containing protein [Sulfurovaceae bacterium]
MKSKQISSKIWISPSKDMMLGKGRVELLEHIHTTGSISQAAKIMKMSYKAAWDSIKALNTHELIVEKQTGGKHGGGSKLTPKGLEYIEVYKELETIQDYFFGALGGRIDSLKNLKTMTSKLTLRTSARNQLHTKISKIDRKDHSIMLTLTMENTQDIKVSITPKSLEEMKLKEHMPLIVLLKASSITLHEKCPPDAPHNWLHGTVKSIDTGGDYAEAMIELDGGGTIIASLTAIECESVNIDKFIWAHFKSSSAIVAI